VRDSAVNKATWDDAIESMASEQGSNSHSLDTISMAIKIMLEDCLKETHIDPRQPKICNKEVCVVPADAQTPLFSSFIPNPIEDQLRSEIDDLRSRLTDSECIASELVDINKKQLKQISDLKDELGRSQIAETETRRELQAKIEYLQSGDGTRSLQAELEAVRMQFNEAQKDLEISKNEIERNKSEIYFFNNQIKQLTEELAKARHVSEPEMPTGLSPDKLPSILEWKQLHAKLGYLLSVQDKGQFSAIDSLMSQIQTLEVQKNDADAEITRLANLLKSSEQPQADCPGIHTPSVSSSFIAAGVPKTRTDRRSTVSIYRQGERDFVRTPDFPSIASDSRRRRTERKSRTNSSNTPNCVQQ
jgi:predicted  nucleic acid-binding Zn-ribbon protein